MIDANTQLRKAALTGSVLCQRRCIVDAVTDKGDALAFCLKLANLLHLFLRQHFGKNALHTDLRGKNFRRLAVIAP